MRLIAFLVALTGIAQVPDPLGKVSPSDLERGKRLFASNCAGCHGIDGSGGSGPSLTRPKLKRAPDKAALIELITSGIPSSGMPPSWHLLPDGPRQLAGFVRSLSRVDEPPVPGDVEHGKVVYGRSGCSGCHTIRGEGGGFGPELTDIGARRTSAFLRRAVKEPAADVAESFTAVLVEPREGRAVRGLRLNEDSFTIQVKDRTGAFYSFRKADLVKIEKQFDQSLMPGYQNLPDPDLQDLVAYLARLRGEE